MLRRGWRLVSARRRLARQRRRARRPEGSRTARDHGRPAIVARTARNDGRHDAGRLVVVMVVRWRRRREVGELGRRQLRYRGAERRVERQDRRGRHASRVPRRRAVRVNLLQRDRVSQIGFVAQSR